MNCYDNVVVNLQSMKKFYTKDKNIWHKTINFIKKNMSNLCKFFLEWTIFAIWWICTGIVLCSLTIFMVLEHNPCLAWISKNIYKYTIFVVSKILDSTRVICREHSRKRIIIDKARDDEYLERYYLFLKDRDVCKFNIFLHKFIKGDEDDIHDHPWGFFHIILSGGYWEYVTVNEDGETLDQGLKKVWRSPGHYNYARPDYKHRIVLGDEKPWTLFIPFKKTKSWNFWVPLLWTPGQTCCDGDINDEKNMKCTQWKKVDSAIYLARKRKKYIN